MADELRAELAEAKKAFHTANTNWFADPGNFALKEVKLSADLTVKEIEYKIKEAKVDALVTQGKGEDDAQVKEAKAARDDARQERNKASARLDEFTKTAAAPQGTASLLSPLSLTPFIGTLSSPPPIDKPKKLINDIRPRSCDRPFQQQTQRVDHIPFGVGN